MRTRESTAGDVRATPWDRRLTDRLASGAWAAANDPDWTPHGPPLREQIRTSAYWLTLIPLVAFATAYFLVHAHGLLMVAFYTYVLMTPVLRRRLRRREASRQRTDGV